VAAAIANIVRMFPANVVSPNMSCMASVEIMPRDVSNPMPVRNNWISVVMIERYTISNMPAIAIRVMRVICARLALPMTCRSSVSAAGPAT
jgi:hypothetical protein